MKKIAISLIIIAILIIVANVVIFNLLGKSANEIVKYGSNHNVAENDNDDAQDPIVHMTTKISSESLVEIYKALNWQSERNVAVKISTEEPSASNYLNPDLIKNLVQNVDGTTVENNMAYARERSSTAMHYQVAEEHGLPLLQNIDA